MDIVAVLAEVAAAPKAPNLWGALGCALAFSGALFATLDAFADMLLTGGDRVDGRMSPGLRLKSGSKLSAAGITVVSAGTVLALDSNWFAFAALSIAFIVIAGIAVLVLIRHRSSVAAVPDGTPSTEVDLDPTG